MGVAAGNATLAAKLAGYKGSEDGGLKQQGSRMLKKPKIVAAIEKHRASREAERMRLGDTIATREERQRFWSQVMRDPSRPLDARLKASEHLGRSEGDFLDRHQHDFPELPADHAIARLARVLSGPQPS